jgi:hypothetical protein
MRMISVLQTVSPPTWSPCTPVGIHEASGGGRGRGYDWSPSSQPLRQCLRTGDSALPASNYSPETRRELLPVIPPRVVAVGSRALAFTPR